MSAHWRKNLDAVFHMRYSPFTEVFVRSEFAGENPRVLDPEQESALKSLKACVFCAALAAGVFFSMATLSEAYMPLPSPCDLAPLYYGPPQPPECAGLPAPPFCGPCPPDRCYPRHVQGPPPCPIYVCDFPQIPGKAAYRVMPPCPVPPPPCVPPVCSSGVPGLR